MATGKVTFFHDRKGYGFIETDDYDDDVFFHMEDIGGPDLEEGQELEFDVVETDNGPRAQNVKRL
ncbi:MULTISPECIES: cold-shock protein [unclassified Haladaptatus]|jgi:CspA family cold shock protein|uniref:cold-shock protein n=1 Tax=unclassified Haladaptatus TaxID=2622732 RepID=UPI002FCE4981